MPLISRLSRLFTADVHAVLDRIEEPEALLKQAIREMEEEVARGEHQLKGLGHEAQQLEKRRVASAAAVRELDSELDICFAADEEELARSLVKRKLTEEQRNKTLTAQLEAVATASDDLAKTLDEQRQRLTEMQHNAELFTQHAPRDIGAGELTVNQDEVDVAFLREKQRRHRS